MHSVHRMVKYILKILQQKCSNVWSFHKHYAFLDQITVYLVSASLIESYLIRWAFQLRQYGKRFNIYTNEIMKGLFENNLINKI